MVTKKTKVIKEYNKNGISESEVLCKKNKKKQTENDMLKKVKEIINTEAQKCPDFKIIPVCVYPKEIEPIVKECGNKEEMIAEMLANGLLSEADAERYRTDKSVSADEMKYIGQLIQLCEKSQREIEAGKHYPIENLISELKSKYCRHSVRSESTSEDFYE